MKFNMSDRRTEVRESLVDVEVPAYLTNPGEWSVIYNAIELASQGLRGTAANMILGAIERIRKEATPDAKEQLQAKVEAYILGHNDGWGEAQEVEEANNKLPPFDQRDAGAGPFRVRAPIAEAIKSWADRTPVEKAYFRQKTADSVQLGIEVSNKFHTPGITAIAKEVIGGTQD